VAGKLTKWRHGEAVALGMVASGYIAMARGTFSREDFERMEALIRRFGLPTRCKNLKFDFLFNLMKRDKKIKAGKIRFVLPTKIGQVEIVDDVQKSQIAEAVEYLKS
jgi:3-dehydroquinate synthase